MSREKTDKCAKPSFTVLSPDPLRPSRGTPPGCGDVHLQPSFSYACHMRAGAKDLRHLCCVPGPQTRSWMGSEPGHKLAPTRDVSATGTGLSCCASPSSVPTHTLGSSHSQCEKLHSCQSHGRQSCKNDKHFSNRFVYLIWFKCLESKVTEMERQREMVQPSGRQGDRPSPGKAPARSGAHPGSCSLWVTSSLPRVGR